MSKIIKIILIGIFCGASFVFVQPVLAAGLVVQFETAPLPLFQKANFLPGEGVTRWVDVTNNSGETKKIGVKIINKSSYSVDCLSDKLDLVISKNGSPLQLGTLTTFYGAGEQVLSDLNTGATTRYYFSMTFNPGAGNIYQNSTTNFDIEIGFFGEESIGQEITPGGGGGGGSFVASGLTISNETVSSVGINTITITWDTNLNSTSRVIYSPQGFPHLLQVSNPPNYGYVFSTDEDSDKVIKHTVIITGLTSGTIYYYRTVSHASPDTISREYSFTTLGEKEVQTEEKTETSTETEEGGIALGEKTEKREQEIKEITEEERGGVEEEGQIFDQQGKEEKTETESKQELPLLAAVGNILSFGTGNVWVAILIGIIILALLIFIVFRITSKAKRRNFEKNLKK
ncbi:MAG: fibronectin type III domain-containing protein [Candidatus Omnitrophota bacterium]|nr:fibronectin type III domain-containing protein [Candidatus Omnitrophota bacterium]